jgi:guanosine-3',5'-bis(diphosphate) 3'-pyrophosphohydrolase
LGALSKLGLVIYSERARTALRFAERAHRGQQRKGGDEPYILHPVTVATLLAASGAHEDLICAAYLHDVVEDAGVELDEIAAMFGDEVADMVAAVTEDKLRSWQDRKAHTITHLGSASQQVLALKGADCCTNITDVVLDHRLIGDDVWLRFRRGAEQQVWYYATVAETVLERLEGFDQLRTELAGRLDELRSISP